ncbi:MAG: carbohydrate kinase family protein, partial [Acidobacteriaceae bacterium]|nr:carbohydrate kinase family protein [Acidobacteriaceae bacterium]
KTKYVGTVGDDLRGRIQRESLQGTGVDTSGLIVREGSLNQTAYIIIDERTGERTVLWQRPGSLRLEASEIPYDDILNARMLHIDGYDIAAAAHAARVARRGGVPVSLDVDSVYPGFECVLENVDYLVAGSNWPLKWTGETDPFVALARLQNEYGMRVAAMTLGHCGALALERGRWYYSPGFQVTCADTTGAGDVFHGAFCYALLAGMQLGAALDFSNAAAALNCTEIGACGHIPVLAEIEELLRSTRDDTRRISEPAAAGAAVRNAQLVQQN